MNGPVICGVEDAATSPAAVDVARALATRFGVSLLFVHVAESGLDGAAAVDAAKLLRRAIDSSPGTGATAATEAGHPADRLVALARERDASFVVVGCHGPRSSLLGSVSADVSRRAPCPVVVVPTDAPDGSGAARRGAGAVVAV